MEDWWKNTDMGKLKHWKKNLSQHHYVHHKPHMDWREIEPRSLHLQASMSHSTPHSVL
jgi:hypothetical protein